MSDTNYINAMIVAAKENNPTAFDTAFKSEIQTRIADGINDRRADAVAGILGIDLNPETPVDTGSEE